MSNKGKTTDGKEVFYQKCNFDPKTRKLLRIWKKLKLKLQRD